MTAIRPQDFPQLLNKKATAYRAVLIYGSDQGGVHERAMALVRAVAGSLDDAFQVARLSEADLADDPGRLADEVQSLSLMGGTRAVWVEDAGQAFLGAITAILDAPADGNLVIAEAGALAKSAKLRTLFEEARNAAILPCYEDNARDLDQIISEVLKRDGLTISDEARTRLRGLLGSDRLASRGEIEKLALYCMGQKEVTLADVEAAAGDASGLSLDDLCDRVFEGDIAEADSLVMRLTDAGNSPGRLLALASQHLARLQRLRAEVDGGKSADLAIKTARPPVFFARQRSMTNQLRIWESDDLDRAGRTLAAATRQSREIAALEPAIVSRALLGLARQARELRAR